MYYILVLALIAVVVNNPDQVTDAIPGMNEEEREQFRRGITSIAQGISDTTTSGINAILRKFMRN